MSAHISNNVQLFFLSSALSPNTHTMYDARHAFLSFSLNFLAGARRVCVCVLIRDILSFSIWSVRTENDDDVREKFKESVSDSNFMVISYDLSSVLEVCGVETSDVTRKLL